MISVRRLESHENSSPTDFKAMVVTSKVPPGSGARFNLRSESDKKYIKTVNSNAYNQVYD